MPEIKPVFLEESNCNGCVNCMKRCPTEAIRVRDGKAAIMYERCVGCGQCVKACPTGAKKEYFDRFSSVSGYKYKVAVPSPSIYGQFNNLDNTDFVLNGLIALGFDAVYEVAYAAELISDETRRYLKTAPIKPVISSACPAVVNLILLRYESLIPHLSPIITPEHCAAKLALKEALEKGYKREEIGIFVITQCAANVLHLKTNAADVTDGVLSLKEIYFPLLNCMHKLTKLEPLKRAGKIGVAWGSSTGEALGLKTDRYLAADGIENVLSVLNELEHDKLSLEFLEINACDCGCSGGSLNMENPFLSGTRLRLLRNSMPENPEKAHIDGLYIQEPFAPNNIYKLDDDRVRAMQKAIKIKEIYSTLPQLDCGACGAPNCMAFAEDIVKGVKATCKYQNTGNKV